MGVKVAEHVPLLQGFPRSLGSALPSADEAPESALPPSAEPLEPVPPLLEEDPPELVPPPLEEDPPELVLAPLDVDPPEPVPPPLDEEVLEPEDDPLELVLPPESPEPSAPLLELSPPHPKSRFADSKGTRKPSRCMGAHGTSFVPRVRGALQRFLFGAPLPRCARLRSVGQGHNSPYGRLRSYARTSPPSPSPEMRTAFAKLFASGSRSAT